MEEKESCPLLKNYIDRINLNLQLSTDDAGLEKPHCSAIFIKDKNSIYFMGIESNAKQNLENFSRSILESDSRNPAESVFLTFQSALE